MLHYIRCTVDLEPTADLDRNALCYNPCGIFFCLSSCRCCADRHCVVHWVVTDTTPPTISSVSISNQFNGLNLIRPGQTLSISFSVTDNVEVATTPAGWTILIGPPGSPAATLTSNSVNSGTRFLGYSWTVPFSATYSTFGYFLNVSDTYNNWRAASADSIMVIGTVSCFLTALPVDIACWLALAATAAPAYDFSSCLTCVWHIARLFLAMDFFHFTIGRQHQGLASYLVVHSQR